MRGGGVQAGAHADSRCPHVASRVHARASLATTDHRWALNAASALHVHRASMHVHARCEKPEVTDLRGLHRGGGSLSDVGGGVVYMVAAGGGEVIKTLEPTITIMCCLAQETREGR